MMENEDLVDLLLIRVSGRDCALPLAHVREVVPLAALLQSPTMPRLLEGFLNLAGVMHPVLRLDRALALPEFTADLYTPILVAKNLGRPLAFLAESASRVVRVPRKDLHPMPASESWNGCVTAEFRRNEEPVAVLDPARLLVREEEAALAEFRALGETRAPGLGAGGGR